MVKYLGEMEEDDLIMFVLEHLKDHKGPQKLVEGLEPVCLSRRFIGLVQILTLIFTGFGRRSNRVQYQLMASNNFREHGIWRGYLDGKNACGLKGLGALLLVTPPYCGRRCVV